MSKKILTDVLRQVASTYDVKQSELLAMGTIGKRQLNVARGVAMLAYQHHARIQWAEVGRAFGRSPSTVCCAIRLTKAKMKKSRKFKEQVQSFL